MMFIPAGIFGQQVAGGGGSVAPTVVSITPTIVTVGTTHNISLGPTVDSGDLLLIFVANDGSSSDLPATAASGWSRIMDLGNSEAGAAVFKKIADGSEGGTTINITTPSTESLSAQCFRINTWSGNTADIVFGGPTLDVESTTAIPPSLTSGFGAVPTLSIAAVATAEDRALSSGPADYTMTQTGTLSNTDGQIRTGWRQLTASSTTPGDFVFSTAIVWSTTTVAVRGT